MTFVLMALAVFVSSAVIDYCHAHYVSAFVDGSYLAMCWTAAQAAAGSVGFILAVKVTMWFLPFELAGLATGTGFAIRRKRARREDG